MQLSGLQTIFSHVDLLERKIVPSLTLQDKCKQTDAYFMTHNST